MMPVSGIHAAQSLTAAERIPGGPGGQKPREEEQDRPLRPVVDEYVPEEPREPSGRYWMGRDESGRPRICFDDPARGADGPKEAPPSAGSPEEPKRTDGPDARQPDAPGGGQGPGRKGEKEERCVGNTDKVDREIEKLKKQKEELEQRIRTEHDEDRIKDLERQLAQVERELSRKDNDAYRRQHATFTEMS